MAFGALVSTPIAGQILITTGSFKDVGAYAGEFVWEGRRGCLKRFLINCLLC